MPSAKPPNPETDVSSRRWLKRLGVAGFLFFLIKGLLWLLVPALVVYFGVDLFD